MTDTFTASNGVTLHPHDSRMDVNCSGSAHPDGHKLSVKETEALREFFQHERDEELGRWRWPENPDYVVYPVIQSAHEMAFGQNLSVMVFHEPTGVLKGYCREEDQGGDLTREYPGAARAYFEAHPERKPWHSAKPGEIWVLTIDDSEQVVSAVQQYEKDFNPISHPIYATFANGSERITAGRRIWPEDAS